MFFCASAELLPIRSERATRSPAAEQGVTKGAVSYPQVPSWADPANRFVNG